jgi:hypothetical protein
VAVGSLLSGEGDGREALWVCEASGDDELVSLAQQLSAETVRETRAARALRAGRSSEGTPRAEAAPARSAPRGSAPQDMAWSRDTSGFGLTRASAFAELGAPAAKPASWLDPSRWLRRSNVR